MLSPGKMGRRENEAMEKMKPLLYDADQLKEYFRHIECAAIYGAGDYGKTLIDYRFRTRNSSRIVSPNSAGISFADAQNVGSIMPTI